MKTDDRETIVTLLYRSVLNISEILLEKKRNIKEEKINIIFVENFVIELDEVDTKVNWLNFVKSLFSTSRLFSYLKTYDSFTIC